MRFGIGSSAGKESAGNARDPCSIPGLRRSPGEGIGYSLQYSWASLVAQKVKNPSAMWKTWVWSLGWKDPLEGMATHSSILAWRIPWTEKPGGLQSMGLQRVRHDWATKHSTALGCTFAELNEIILLQRRSSLIQKDAPEECCGQGLVHSGNWDPLCIHQGGFIHLRPLYFSSSHVEMWELDLKEGLALKNWCFRTVMLEKTFESPLDCKEIKPINPKGNQPWIFIGRIDAEAEAPILLQPDVKTWLIGKDPNTGKDWRQEEKGTTENEKVGWHHRLNGYEFEQTSGDSGRQGSPGCCSPWDHKESGTTA